MKKKELRRNVASLKRELADLQTESRQREVERHLAIDEMRENCASLTWLEMVNLQDTQIEELKHDLERTKEHLRVVDSDLLAALAKAEYRKSQRLTEELIDAKSEIQHREDAAWTIGEMNAAAAKIETLTADNSRITEALCERIAELQTANRRIVEQDRRVEGLLKRLFRAEKQIDEIVSIIGIDQ